MAGDQHDDPPHKDYGIKQEGIDGPDRPIGWHPELSLGTVVRVTGSGRHFGMIGTVVGHNIDGTVSVKPQHSGVFVFTQCYWPQDLDVEPAPEPEPEPFEIPDGWGCFPTRPGSGPRFIGRWKP